MCKRCAKNINQLSIVAVKFEKIKIKRLYLKYNSIKNIDHYKIIT